MTVSLVNAADRVQGATNGDRQTTAPLVQRKPHTRVNKAARADLGEIGTYGLRQYGGYVIEEWLRQLQGSKRAWAYREMMDNDPVVGAILYAIRMLARGASFPVKPGKVPADAEFIEQAMGDMSHTWGDFVSEALSMLGYGWKLSEIVYKRRTGPQPDSSKTPSSDFNDGRIGWRKLPSRAQETLLHWDFDPDDDGLVAMHQLDYHGRHNIIPIEKALLFRTRKDRNNPEGISLLRNAFVPWARLKEIQEIEAIGIERDLAGIPVATPPPDVDLNSPQNANLLAAYQELVTCIRRDEDEGVVMPQAGAKLELLTTGGSRQIDTDAIIRRYEQRIASSVLADFILIGQDAVGSFAMVDVKADLFGIAIDGILDIVCEVVNRYAIPRLLALNGMDVSEPPQITHSSSGRINLATVGTFLNQMSLAGAPIPWSEDLIEALFKAAGLPVDFDAKAAVPLEKPAGPDRIVDRPQPPAPNRGAEQQPAKPADDVNVNGGQQSTPDLTAALSKADRMQVENDARLAEIDAEMDALIDEQNTRKVTKTQSQIDGLRQQVLDLANSATGSQQLAESLIHVVAKAQSLVPNAQGALPISPILRQRAKQLQALYETDMQRALADLGDQAHRAYHDTITRLVGKATTTAPPTDAAAATLAQRVMSRLNLQGWYDNVLQPLITSHAQRVMQDTLQTLNTQIGLAVNIPDPEQARIIAAGGTKLGLADIESEVRASIMQAIADGRDQGLGANEIAQRIRMDVPAGRFTNAGSGYRAKLISRTESLNASRATSLAAYAASPQVQAVEISDGILEDSDSECQARDGDVVSFDTANSMNATTHPMCTLSWNPVLADAGSLLTE